MFEVDRLDYENVIVEHSYKWTENKLIFYIIACVKKIIFERINGFFIINYKRITGDSKIDCLLFYKNVYEVHFVHLIDIMDNRYGGQIFLQNACPP